ncbi:uncharacterized protein L3040_004590 [Drepanopeziza brunnea f. sp. 'multigermtubi']|uniref:uncharacterized protein n=1 Tax=Drepanopeziza brunnea f. sp. 'multigermtubi' TaxID=698441 RepID=UPI002399CFC0|nr:hypothetical protein L3040_004590 [Drepanopeziza brunnea f. sp. 'multigermtubi']
MSTPCSVIRSAPHKVTRFSSIVLSCRPLRAVHPIENSATRSLATVRPDPKVFSDVWFTGAVPRLNIHPPPLSSNPRKPDERTVKLGKTLRILQERLPTLLQSPLPQEILSPHISLHLFPSTHPHLPTVSGRVAYSAALWTSPIAWGRVPLVGEVRLTILSERMVKSSSNARLPSATRQEQLIVRWRTVGKTKGKGIGAFYKGIGARESVDKITEWLGGGNGEDDSKEFTGLFIFEFDEEGRILSHTIEHVREGGNWERGVGARVVGLTDWLLGGMKRNGNEGAPCPACYSGESERANRRQ